MNQKVEPRYSGAEREIERLVSELDRLIEREAPEERRELRMLASSLISQNMGATETTEEAESRTPRSMGILAGGLGLLIVGGALFILLPPIALIMIVLGIVGVIWGAISGLINRSTNTK